MGRILLLITTFFTGFLLLNQDGWDLLRLDERLMWAMLLPGAYLLGLVMLRD
jgi:UPF0716 family protein affecting phage T7 exclusion